MSDTIKTDVPCSTQVLEVHLDTLSYEKDSEIVYVEADVEDAVLMRPETRHDPEEWGPGRCYAEILWPLDDPLMGFPMSDAVERFCKTNPFIEWTLIPFNEL